MKRMGIILGALMALLVAGYAATYLMDRSFRPEAAVLEKMRATYSEPRIVDKADQKMLVVVTIGDPSEFAGKAIMKLFNALGELEADHPDIEKKSPLARWPKPVDTPRDQYEGHWAMPVPNSVTELPPIDSDDGLEVKLETWQYGQVAEILHIGPYDNETVTVDLLKAFLDEKGYEIAGVHEEEYANGPSMFPYLDKPDQYHTIIRYPVKKK